TTGYYIKGVRHGDNVFVMELDYVGAVCRIPASMVAQISHAFDGSLPANSPAGSPEGASPAPAATNAATNKLTKIYVKRYGVSVLIPTEIFPEATKLTTGEET